jgi:hypothetical protein
MAGSYTPYMPNFNSGNTGVVGPRNYSTNVPVSQPNTAPGSTYGNPNPFYSDPVNRYFEDQVKRSVDQVNAGTPKYLDETYDLLRKNLFGKGGGSGGGSGGGGGDFGDGGVGRFTGYIDGRPMNEASKGLGTYIAGRTPNAASQGLEGYMGGRENFVQEYRNYANPRIAQLNEDPFDDTIMAAQRTHAFDSLERDRSAALDAEKERSAARGILPSSGATGDRYINEQFNTQRGQLQNQMVRDRFSLVQENRKQADSLAQTLGGFAQAGVSMTDAIKSAAASLKFSEQQATDLLMKDKASLTFSERQARDQLEAQLGQLSTQIRGQDTQLAGQRAMAGATSSAARYGAMGALANFGINRAELEQRNRQQGVDFAGLFPGLVQGDLSGLQNLLGGAGSRY